jgi:DNA-directed RNA polymerase subunit K
MIGNEYSKYEKARLVGARALQIAHGATLAIKTDLKDPIAIAILELENNAIPIETRKLIEREH